MKAPSWQRRGPTLLAGSARLGLAARSPLFFTSQVGPLIAATGSTRTPVLVAAGSCLVAVGLVYHFLVASPGEQGAAMGTRAQPAGDEANLLAEDAARGALELPVRAKLAAAVGDDLSPDVWRAKADEPPAWVSPAGVHA